MVKDDSKYLKVNYLPRKDGSIFLRVMNLHEDDEQETEVHNKFIQEMSIQGSWKIEELNKLHEKYDFRKLNMRNNETFISNEKIYANQELLK